MKTKFVIALVALLFAGALANAQSVSLPVTDAEREHAVLVATNAFLNNETRGDVVATKEQKAINFLRGIGLDKSAARDLTLAVKAAGPRMSAFDVLSPADLGKVKAYAQSSNVQLTKMVPMRRFIGLPSALLVSHMEGSWMNYALNNYVPNEHFSHFCAIVPTYNHPYTNMIPVYDATYSGFCSVSNPNIYDSQNSGLQVIGLFTVPQGFQVTWQVGGQCQGQGWMDTYISSTVGWRQEYGPTYYPGYEGAVESRVTYNHDLVYCSGGGY